MNKLVYNYKATVSHVVGGATFDCVLNYGFYQYAKIRYRLIGAELPEFKKDGDNTEDEKVLLDGSREALKKAILNRKIILAPYRPSKTGRPAGNAYIACRMENIMYPMLTEVHNGVRLLNLSRFINLLAEKKFDVQETDKILTSLETYDF